MALQEIRDKEAAIKRRVAEAKNAAKLVLQETRKEAARLKEQAHDEGKQTGQSDSEEILARAEEEAAQIINQTKRWAEALGKDNQQEMETAVTWAVNVVLGGDDEGQENGA